MQPPITREEILGLLICQLPEVAQAQLLPVATALHLIIKAGAGHTPALTKGLITAPTRTRQYREKSVAESQKLKK